MDPASKTNYHLHSFFPNTIKEWNSPPLNVVEGWGTIHKLFPRPAEHAFILLFFSYHQLLPLLKPLTSCQESSYRWRASPWKIIKIWILGLCHMHSVLDRLSTTHFRKMVYYPYRGTGGGRGGWTPPRVFNMLQCFETILSSVESLWSSLQDEVYVALLGICDVANNGRHLGHHLGFYQEWKIRLKPR